ncbi:MAG: hypothetical protein IT303_05575 [Dehalococcoidia bacterium]|nr:hypothetical protein [Dehalococcoidia bacterium]
MPRERHEFPVAPPLQVLPEWSERWHQLGDLLAAAAHGRGETTRLREVLYREPDPTLRMLAAKALLVLGSRTSGSLEGSLHELRRLAPRAVHRGTLDAVLLAACFSLGDDRLTIPAAQAIWPALPAEGRALVTRLVPDVRAAGAALGMIRCAELDAGRSGPTATLVRRWLIDAFDRSRGFIPGRRWAVPAASGLAPMPVESTPAVAAGDMREVLGEIMAFRGKQRGMARP